MTVAVSCNLSEGLVLAVDSATALADDEGGVAKVYENAEKLFQLGGRPIGVAVYGLGALGDRTIGSFLHEFEVQSPAVVREETPLPEVVEAARGFFMDAYRREVVPRVERASNLPWEEIPDERKPILGLVIGGFSRGAYLSEVWQVVVPRAELPGSSELVCPQGSFGINWFAMAAPVSRYMRGYDVELVQALVAYMEERSTPLAQDEQAEVLELLAQFEYQIPYGGMPMEEGVAHARFLVELVVNHHRYAVGAPVVGGRVRVGRVTYRHGSFEILD